MSKPHVVVPIGRWRVFRAPAMLSICRSSSSWRSSSVAPSTSRRIRDSRSPPRRSACRGSRSRGRSGRSTCPMAWRSSRSCRSARAITVTVRCTKSVEAPSTSGAGAPVFPTKRSCRGPRRSSIGSSSPRVVPCDIRTRRSCTAIVCANASERAPGSSTIPGSSPAVEITCRLAEGATDANHATLALDDVEIVPRDKAGRPAGDGTA